MTGTSARHRNRFSEHLGWLLLVAVWAAFTAPMWRGDSNIFLGDLAFIDVPLRVYVGRALRAGWLPVWTDALAGGIPLISESQSGVAYPPTWIFALYPHAKAADWFVAAHYLALGIGLYLLGRQAGAGRLGAGIAASLYMTCWSIRVMHCAPAVQAGFVWLPLSLWLIGQTRVGWTWSIWCSTAVNSLALLPGAPLVILTAVPTCCAYWLYLSWRQDWREWIRGIAILSIFPLLLAAVQVVPVYNYYRESNRRDLSTHELAASNGVPWSYFAPWGVFADESQNLEEPRRPQWPAQLVHGCSAAALAAGLLQRRYPHDLWFWLGFAVICSLASVESPLLWIVNSVPPFSLSRFPGFYLAGAQFAVSLFMAHGFSRLGALGIALSPQRPQWPRAALMVAGAALLGVNWRAADLGRYMSDGPFYSEINATFAADIRDWKGKQRHVRLFAPQSPASLGTSDGMWRESDWRRNAAALAVDYNLIHDIPSIDQYDLLDGTVVNGRLYWFSQLLARGELNAFRAAAMTHVSLEDRYPAPGGYENIAAGGGRFYRSQEDRPPAWMVFQTEFVPDRDQRCARLANPDFNPYAAALVETQDLRLDPVPVEPPSVEMIPDIRGRKEFRVKTTAAGLLVISNTYYTQLEARVNGRKAAVQPVNQAFCGVELPPGEHHVVLSYSPREIYLGLAISLCAWTLAIWRIVHHVRLGPIPTPPS